MSVFRWAGESSLPLPLGEHNGTHYHPMKVWVIEIFEPSNRYLESEWLVWGSDRLSEHIYSLPQALRETVGVSDQWKGRLLRVRNIQNGQTIIIYDSCFIE